MVFKRYGRFTGGIDLPEEKQRTLDRPVEPANAPERLRLPLSLDGSGAARLLVQPGQRVQAGDRLAQSRDHTTVDVFAPLTGTVRQLTTATIVSRDGCVPVDAIELTELEGPWNQPAVSEMHFDVRDASDEQLRTRLGEGSLPTFGAIPESLARWLQRATGCETIICNGVESQPYVTAGHRLLAERGGEVVRGLAILARAIGASERILAVDRRRTGAYGELLEPAALHRIARVALPPKYPAGAPPLLVKTLKRREVPAGRPPEATGVAMTDPATCQTVYRWVAGGLRATGRVVTCSGEHVDQPANVYAPLGMDAADLVDGPTRPLIHGGPMSGTHLTSGTVVTPGTDAVLALSEAGPERATACIRCTWCLVCPARLNVSALNDAYELGELDRAQRLGAMACFECGTCSYVCPARLPLAQRIKQIKREITRPHATEDRRGGRSTSGADGDGT